MMNLKRREHFAAVILAGLLGSMRRYLDPEEMVRLAVLYADTLMEELDRGEQKTT